MKLNALLLTVSLGLAATPGAWAYPDSTLYNNLGNVQFSGMEAAGNTWQASKFTTDGNNYLLESVVLLMAQSGESTARLDIYSNYGDVPETSVPGTSLGTLTHSGSFSDWDTFTEATFTPTGIISLSANSSYWVVLQGVTGSLWWSYTEDGTGIGPGFSKLYTISENAGNNWDLPADTMPNQMQVNATLAAVPEPSQWAMMGVTALGVTGYALRRRLAKTN